MKFLLLILIVTANEAIKCPEKATSPVCGLDGAIHANDCKLEKFAKGLPVAWSFCVCSEPARVEKCSDTKNFVCGSDGKTYKNRCHLLIASCENNGTVFETDDQPMSCKVHDCPETAIQPICAVPCSNPTKCFAKLFQRKEFSFYANPCLIGKNSELEIRFASGCDCDIHGPCPPDETQVCGNDKKMYKNRCELIHSYCKYPVGKLREVPAKCCETQDETSSLDCL